MAEFLYDQFHQGLTDQARLSGAGNTCHRCEYAQGKIDGELAEIVAGDATQAQPPNGCARCAVRQHVFAEQVTAG
jgi:hypothetical protein